VCNPLDSTPNLKGNYLKGKRTGEWVAGWGTEVYDDDVLVKTIPSKAYLRQTAIMNEAADKVRREANITNAIEPIDFGKFLQQRLASYFKPYFDKNAATEIIIAFTITEQGKLTNGRSVTKVSDSVQEQVARAINAAPYWAPAQRNGKPITQQMTYTLVFDNIR